MDPQQELYTELLMQLRELGYDVYDGALPPEGTPYPFIYLADTRQADFQTKSVVGGNIYQTVHVWHDNPRERGTVSAMLLAVKLACRRVCKTTNHVWLVRNMEQRILPDNSTRNALLHGIVEAEFRFY